jgi:hypothetical protein
MLASYPRSGSRWFEMMLAELLVGHEVDFYTRPIPIPFTSFVRASSDSPRPLAGGGRVIKTHEPFRREYRRGIYLVRHPGDVASSYYRQLSQWALPNIGFDAWFRAWIRGEIDGYRTWQENVESWLDAPVPVEVIRYEDLKADPERALKAALRLLGMERDQGTLRRAVEHNALNRMLEKVDAGGSGFGHGEVPPRPTDIPDVRGQSSVWDDVLTPSQRELLQRHAGRAMHRLGYELTVTEERPRASSSTS